MKNVRRDLAYCRAGLGSQDLARQRDAVRAAAVAEEHIYLDTTTGPMARRQGMTALIRCAGPGDRITVVTLDRLGCSLRETLRLVHDFTELGIFVRTLDDALPLDTSVPGPGTDMAVALLTRLAHLERPYRAEHAASARAAKRASAPRQDRPVRPGAGTGTGTGTGAASGPILVGALPPRLL